MLPELYFSKIYFYFCVICICVVVCHMCMDAHIAQESASDPLELQVAMNLSCGQQDSNLSPVRTLNAFNH